MENKYLPEHTVKIMWVHNPISETKVNAEKIEDQARLYPSLTIPCIVVFQARDIPHSFQVIEQDHKDHDKYKEEEKEEYRSEYEEFDLYITNAEQGQDVCQHIQTNIPNLRLGVFLFAKDVYYPWKKKYPFIKLITEDIEDLIMKLLEIVLPPEEVPKIEYNIKLAREIDNYDYSEYEDLHMHEEEEGEDLNAQYEEIMKKVETQKAEEERKRLEKLREEEEKNKPMPFIEDGLLPQRTGNTVLSSFLPGLQPGQDPNVINYQGFNPMARRKLPAQRTPAIEEIKESMKFDPNISYKGPEKNTPIQNPNIFGKLKPNYELQGEPEPDPNELMEMPDLSEYKMTKKGQETFDYKALLQFFDFTGEESEFIGAPIYGLKNKEYARMKKKPKNYYKPVQKMDYVGKTLHDFIDWRDIFGAEKYPPPLEKEELRFKDPFEEDFHRRIDEYHTQYRMLRNPVFYFDWRNAPTPDIIPTGFDFFIFKGESTSGKTWKSRSTKDGVN